MFERILVPLDGSPSSERILPHVETMASAFKSRVVLIQVLDSVDRFSAPYASNLIALKIEKKQAWVYLDNFVHRLEAFGIQAEFEVMEGKAAESILNCSARHNVDLILLNRCSNSGIIGQSIGGVAHKIIQLARKSFMIVCPQIDRPLDLNKQRYKRLLVPLDCSQRAEFVLPAAITLSRCLGSEIYLAHVVKRPEIPWRTKSMEDLLKISDQMTERNRDEAQQYLSELQHRSNAKVFTCVTVSHEVAESIRELACRVCADLIIMSAHGQSANTRHHFGGVSHKLIAFGDVPLLVLQDLPGKLIEQSPVEKMSVEHWGH